MLLCYSTVSRTMRLPTESVLPSLAHLMRPAQLPPMHFTLPNGSILTARSGGWRAPSLPSPPLPLRVASVPSILWFSYGLVLIAIAIGYCLLVIVISRLV
jgi:hypothetical protein